MAMSSRPHIFQFITRLVKGGAEDHLIATVTEMDGFDFTIGHGAAYNSEVVERLENEGVETKKFPLVRHYNPITAVPAVFSVANYIRQHDFDIVHTNSTEAGIIGRFAAKLAGAPTIVHTVHGIPFSQDRNVLLNRFVLACERAAARHTDRIITNADIMAEEYLDRGIGMPDQYKTIYSGVELDEFRDVDPADDLPGSRPRVVMIGRLVDGKGFDVLLDAVEKLNANASVCLVGEGPLANQLEAEIADRKLSERVFLTGFRDDVPRVLAASDMLVLPSYREGTPRVITEAMASGLPVIATDVAGIPEQVADGKSGYLVPTGDAETLADRLDDLLMDPGRRRRFGQRGYQRAERFSKDTLVDSTAALYTDLLSGTKD